jgi:hypothetical protein
VGARLAFRDGTECVCDRLTVVSPRKKAVHLYSRRVLIADRWTDRHRPAEYYVVSGTVYDVTSFEAILEADGSDGFDVEVIARR